MIAITACSSLICDGQFQIYTTNYGRTQPAIRSVAVGNLLTAPTVPQAFEIRGELMPVGWRTGEVFRTVSPAENNSYWRLYSGGTAAGDERGQLYSESANSNFNINSPNGFLNFHTQNVQRARFNMTQNTNLNGWTRPTDGFFALSGRPEFFPFGEGPFTRLHLIDGTGSPGDPNVYAQELGYRPWMRNGITFTGNSDQAYIGQKYAWDANGNDINDNTDFVIQWSDNPAGSPWGVDRMKFVFSSSYTGATKGMGSFDGMEAMRFWPNSSTTVNVGIGDFAPVAIGDPTERLDILNGKLRIRDLPGDAPANGLTKVLVVDDTPSPSGQRGVIKWRDVSTIGGGGGGCGSGWTLVGNNAATAFNGNPCIPQDVDLVGIGISSPAAKLDVRKVVSSGQLSDIALQAWNSAASPSALCFGGSFTSSGTSNTGIGVTALALGGSNLNIGVRGIAQGGGSSTNRALVAEASGGFNNTGIYVQASGGSVAWGTAFNAANATVTNYGFSGTASGGQESIGGEVSGSGATNYNTGVNVTGTGGLVSYGLRGKANGASTHNYALYTQIVTTDTDPWAAYLNGKAFCTAGVWSPSDEQLKTDIQPITNASEVIAALHPSVYSYRQAEFPSIALPSGRQAGLIAQQLAEVEPTLVTRVTQPAEYDREGNLITAEVPFDAINYTGLIPYLIGAVQEQQQQIAELREQLDACCAAGPRGELRGAPQQGMPSEDGLKKESLQIAPNPFTDRTTVSYTVPQAGRVRLEVSTQDGRRVEVLREERAQAGAFTYEWNTSGSAPGAYLVTLLLDEKVIVKKAVKVGQ